MGKNEIDQETVQTPTISAMDFEQFIYSDSTDEFKAGVLWLEQEILDFLQSTDWEDISCSKLMQKMAIIKHMKRTET